MIRILHEIDLLVELMDKDQIEFFLRLFKENHKKCTIDLKKIRLKRCMKNHNGKKISFYNVLNIYKMEKFKNLSLKEILKDDINIGNDIKFANAIIYYENEIKEFLPKISENIKSNKNPFYEIKDTISEEDINNYFINRYSVTNIEEGINLNKIAEELLNENMDATNKINKEIEGFNAEEFYNYLIKNQNTEMDLPILSAFLKRNTLSEEEVKLIYKGLIRKKLLNTHIMRVKKFKEEEGYDTLDVLNNKITSSSKELEYLNEQIGKLKVNNIRLGEENKQLNSNNEDFKNKIKEKDIDRSKMEKSFKEEMNSLKNQNMSLKTKCDMYTKEISIFSCSADIIDYEVVIITNNSINLMKNMFPEIKFYSLVQWYTVDISKKHIQKVLIHRNGISSLDINLIEENMDRYKIKHEIIIARDQRELMDFILAFIKKDWVSTYEGL